MPMYVVIKKNMNASECCEFVQKCDEVRIDGKYNNDNVALNSTCLIV